MRNGGRLFDRLVENLHFTWSAIKFSNALYQAHSGNLLVSCFLGWGPGGFIQGPCFHSASFI